MINTNSLQNPRFICLIMLSALSACLPLRAVELPALFSDHAVLQSGADTPVWGRGREGEAITVTFAGATASTTVSNGTWMVRLKNLVPTAVGQNLVVKGDNTLTIHDVLVGDVWLCSGQSNMELDVANCHNAREVMPKAADAGLRLFLVPKWALPAPTNDVKACWTVCTPASVGRFSAVGYFFSRELRTLRKCPIGLIDSAWGGTPAQAWTSTEGLAEQPPFTAYLQSQATYAREFDQKMKAFKENETITKSILQSNAVALADWNKAVATAKAANQPEPPKPAVQPVPQRLFSPHTTPAVSALYNGMIAPLVPYGLTGVIWYQGEANRTKADEYATLFPRLIQDWRGKWGRGDFPFLFVHLSTWSAPQQRPVEPGDFPQVRQTQQAALSLPKTGMASALDINAGPDIHPKDKEDVGKRLALVARKVAYGEDVACESPRFKGLVVEGSAVRVTLEHAEGLHVAVPPWLGPKATVPSATEPASFAVCGADGVWQWAKARIDGATLVLTSDKVAAPVAAAFAWAANTQVNVYNAQNLPLLPFVSDPAKLPKVQVQSVKH